MARPTLLLTVNESRDQAGPVTPTLGTGTSVVSGHYGSAWLADATGEYVRVVNNGHLGAAGAILLRVQRPANPSALGRIVQIGADGSNGFVLRYSATGANLYIYRPTVLTLSAVFGGAPPVDQIVVQWGGGTVSLSMNGGTLATASATWAAPASPDMNFANGTVSTAPLAAPFEAAAIYDGSLTNAERTYVTGFPGAWTWDALTIPKRTLAPVLNVGASHVGPLRAGKA